ncbi:MAG: glycerophosphodiester phosphodiesterase [Terrimicrobiaceae bacterium]
MKLLLAPFLMILSLPIAHTSGPAIIAHRGASGFLPEHTLEAKAYAHALGAAYIEQDVVLTKDNHTIVLHDIYLDATTDVADIFPGRARDDGRYYAIDFSLDEIRRLTARERIDPATGQQAFPGRFQKSLSGFQIATLEEEILLIQELNRTTGRVAGIYPELKAPAFHEKEGKDIVAVVHGILTAHGYMNNDDPCIIQCFEVAPLLRLRKEFGSKLRLVQLIADPAWRLNIEDYPKMVTSEGLDTIASYADGIGPAFSLVMKTTPEGLKPTPLVENARSRGLFIHPYTLRRDALPAGLSEGEIFDFLKKNSIDGVFTDFPAAP